MWLRISTYSPTQLVTWLIHDNAHCVGEWVEVIYLWNVASYPGNSNGGWDLYADIASSYTEWYSGEKYARFTAMVTLFASHAFPPSTQALWFEMWLRISTYSPTQLATWLIHDNAHCVGKWAEICNRTSNHVRLHHQTDHVGLPDFSLICWKTWEGLGMRLD